MAAIGGVSLKTATIDAGESVSDEVDLEAFVLAGLIMPAAWTTAEITLLAATESGGTFQDVYDDQGNEIIIQADASRSIGIDLLAGALAAFQFIKIRSGVTALPVLQVAEAIIKLTVKA